MRVLAPVCLSLMMACQSMSAFGPGAGQASAIATGSVDTAATGAQSGTTTAGNTGASTSGCTSTSIGCTPPVDFIADFENGIPAEFTTYGAQGWGTTTDQSWSGTHSAVSGNIGDTETSVLELSITVEEGAALSFWTRGGSEITYDFLHFRVDDNPPRSWDGTWDWTQHTEALAAGDHALTWAYVKDPYVSTGVDGAWIDLVEIAYP